MSRIIHAAIAVAYTALAVLIGAGIHLTSGNPSLPIVTATLIAFAAMFSHLTLLRRQHDKGVTDKLSSLRQANAEMQRELAEICCNNSANTRIRARSTASSVPSSAPALP